MVIIDSQKQGIVGELDEVDVCIADARTTIKMYMVGSTTKTLLLGINWITKYKADILGSIKKLRFVYQEKPMEVDLFIQRPPAVVYQTSEGHSTDEYEAIFTTMFEEDYEGKDLKERSFENIENRNYYINDEIQETDWSEKANDWYIPADLELEDRSLYLLTLESRSEQTSTIRREFENIALRYKEIIADDTKSLGRTHLIEHTIDLIHPFLIQTKGNPLNLPTRQWLKGEVEDMLRRGIICSSNSPYAAGISIATKKDGSLRFCYAAIGLNDATIDDLYTIPNITELMDLLAGFEYCSIADLASGFWQISVAERDRYKTAFRTPWGLYEFNVMPFGLKNAPATFQRLMIRVLRQYLYDFVIVYIDDILIYSKSKEKHKRHLHLVFQALRKAGLKIKLKKCEFGRKS